MSWEPCTLSRVTIRCGYRSHWRVDGADDGQEWDALEDLEEHS